MFENKTRAIPDEVGSLNGRQNNYWAAWIFMKHIHTTRGAQKHEPISMLVPCSGKFSPLPFLHFSIWKMAFNECNPRKQGLEPEMQEVHAGENNAGMGQAPFLLQKRQSFEGSNEKKNSGQPEQEGWIGYKKCIVSTPERCNRHQRTYSHLPHGVRHVVGSDGYFCAL